LPTYDYQCNKCGFKFETMHNIKEKPLVNCPNCNLPNLEKLISAPAIIVKGTKTPCNGGHKIEKPKEKFIPFWRKGEKVNKKILKNPEKYINTGEV